MTKTIGIHETFANGMTLQQLAKFYREQGEKLFRRRHPYPFLLLHQMPDSENQGDLVDPRTVESGLVESPGTSQEAQPLYVLPLAKSNRNVFTSKVTIGRAKNNDVIIRSSKISKLHAAVAVAERFDDYKLADMGSANGTYINDQRLTPKEASPPPRRRPHRPVALRVHLPAPRQPPATAEKHG